MNIFVNEENKQFHLTNGKISYIFNVLKNGSLGHLYFGKSIKNRDDFSHFLRTDIPTAASCHFFQDDPAYSLETVNHEYPVYGKGDFRDAAIELETKDGRIGNGYVFKDYKISHGKPKFNGLPATYANEKEASTITVQLVDESTHTNLYLSYTIFQHYPVITRSVALENVGTDDVYIKKIMSSSIDFPDSDYKMIHLAGTWSRERHIEAHDLRPGVQSIASIRGASSHHHNPFIALKRKTATEHENEVYGFNFVYSSNFLAQVEVDHYEVARVMVGIHPHQFRWKLAANECFQAPEVVMVYSEKGLNGMSQSFHDLYRNHLISEPWKTVERPILINNWEATYFDFDEEKLVRIAESARELGIELFVLDDGWFGKRNDDTSSLGDWYADEEKLPKGLPSLAKKVNDLGMQFGLWFEPEMINPNSQLYQSHSEWVVGRREEHLTFGRNQLVLDFSREEVVQYLFEKMRDIIIKTQLSYIKWDMNRNITDAFSVALKIDQQGEFFHRYILGVYALYEKLTTEFPNVLFESCAGGGGRFDPGMFYYAPQAWASDNTDAVERLKIQYGTSLVYPIYSIGSHVSASPNHQTLRATSLEMRANTAYFGTFGYELNPLELNEEERSIIKDQIRLYTTHRSLIRDGDFYRLLSPFEQNETAWMIVSKDKKEALVGYYKVLTTPNSKKQQILSLKGLDDDVLYTIEETKQSFCGDELMYRGLPLSIEFNGVNSNKAERGGDYQSVVYFLKGK
ncbi:alpha-galactosidase [Alkalihalobacillus alcalophilus ATCC 27647 = CGMCC 1.3604]|uniref:Alpha-galactosidase n=1 Tax=Alkalihalobacillus alcalophilus ATCC 27647 = CGMCC 1.3604 TaxID=1218173 RepID=A0A4S4K093_ALKAL|nr:alpha-galactosidase [Alkalihalobacillus alcalophilus]MED1561817.1 alpha-galactosidase [Alkalihalobacillus alcalophilus]THG90984.1 alpha-galactosidase [Alkalihalobacillus alcalophilus ATCC 27647 = CGMCC 1.3604]